MKTATFLLILLSLNCFARKDPTAEAQPIVAEGKRLYRSEMASWYGTDLFLAKHKDQSDIGGYVSYVEGDSARCVYFSKGKAPLVIGTVSFDSTYNIKIAKVDLSVRDLTAKEKDLYLLRRAAARVIEKDTFFKRYNNTNFNAIPLIEGDEKKVYILTGTNENGVVIFGNDYLLLFDQDNNLKSKKRLHVSFLPMEYGKEGEAATEAIHSHQPETGDFITATDICTLMLYQSFTKWKTHTVVSKKYYNFWSCEKNILTVIPRKAMDRIYEDQEKRHKTPSVEK